MRHSPRPAAVAESKVMGRAAVVWVIAVVQPISIAQITGLARASASVEEAGPTDLPTLWSATAILAGLFMATSIAMRSPEAQRVWEISADLLLATASLVFMAAALEANGGISGVGWAASTALALAGSCIGRAYFLAHQIWWVRRATGTHA